MPAYQNQTDYNQFNQNSASNQGYDLAAEKQRIAEGTEEIKKELQEKWNKRYADAQIFPDALVGMSQGLLNFLLSFQHTLFYNELAKKFNFSQEQRNVLPQIVWHLCQTKNWNDLNELLQKNIALAPQVNEQIAQSLNDQILSKAKQLSSGETISKTNIRISEENRPTLLQMPLTQALKEIPEIGEQLLTSEKIRILSFPEPVRPSLKNWLADYTSFFGYAKHSPIEMGNYLFHSENTKKLSSSDRQKLTYVLKAFNDGTPVSINKTLKQVVFPTTDSQIRNPKFPASTREDSPRFEESSHRVEAGDRSSTRGGETRNNNRIQNSNFQNSPAQISNTNLRNTAPQASGQISSNIQALNSKLQTNLSQAGNHMQQTAEYQITNPKLQVPNKTQIQNPNFQNNPAQIPNRVEDTKYQIQNTEGLTFSSPQKLPYEYEKETPPVQKPSIASPTPPANLPWQNNQSERNNPNTVILEKKPDPPRPMGRNVVDLRQE